MIAKVVLGDTVVVNTSKLETGHFLEQDSVAVCWQPGFRVAFGVLEIKLVRRQERDWSLNQHQIPLRIYQVMCENAPVNVQARLGPEARVYWSL
jgi:hypothetical protein